jgi:hypothetical protein
MVSEELIKNIEISELRDLSEITHELTGRRQYTLPYGHMPFTTPLSSTTPCRCWRTAHQVLSFSAQFVLVAT